MRLILLLLVFISLSASGQNGGVEIFEKDSLIRRESRPDKGFHHDYLLFIPKGTPKNKHTWLLVEPNNTGKVSDSSAVHLKRAVFAASGRSVGNNISTELKIPLLVPVFPRPESKFLVYTHALDRDTALEETPDLKRLDLQLIAMIKDARGFLQENGIELREKIFMNGFSASATFTNRFLFIHPEMVAAAAMGGLNGKLMLPLETYKGRTLDYPLGLNDFNSLFSKDFNKTAYAAIPQYMYMGALDTNDAVKFDDAYSDREREIINSTLGSEVQPRWLACQEVYKENDIHAVFRTYENIGHRTTSSVNLDVILFFLGEMKKR